MLLRSILIRDAPVATTKAAVGAPRAWLEGREPSVLIAHASADAYGSDRACLEVAMAARDAGPQSLTFERPAAQAGHIR